MTENLPRGYYVEYSHTRHQRTAELKREEEYEIRKVRNLEKACLFDIGIIEEAENHGQLEAIARNLFRRFNANGAQCLYFHCTADGWCLDIHERAPEDLKPILREICLHMETRRIFLEEKRSRFEETEEQKQWRSIESEIEAVIGLIYFEKKKNKLLLKALRKLEHMEAIEIFQTKGEAFHITLNDSYARIKGRRGRVLAIMVEEVNAVLRKIFTKKKEKRARDLF